MKKGPTFVLKTNIHTSIQIMNTKNKKQGFIEMNFKKTYVL